MNSVRIAILSDIHYASDAERNRGLYYLSCVKDPLRRAVLKLYRHYYWQRDPFAHNHMLDQFLQQCAAADLVIAVGDYSCDSAFVGLSDDAAFASAAECLGKLREKFPDRFIPTLGDHELGKKPLGADLGGVRLASYYRATENLGVEPFWQRRLGNYVLIGVMSTLIAWPVFDCEALPEEQGQWEKLRASHLEQIRRTFGALRAEDRVLLFCHDPTALPFLWREETVRQKLSQVERTIIGHLHSNWILFKSRVLSGMPRLRFFGHTTRRLSSALREAHYWKPFNLLLCPSISGIELLKDGGYYTAELWPEAEHQVKFQRHHLHRIAKSSP